ncbi:uncharacterized protein STEHIDRAFT_111306 [Stereum hirsutum FP-91666 SS1]|uniref:uncharacterized protein n=1 Tax=Stereum hirsutum (strain FP-91666) TaxID=721885 RepID=UPI000444A311|nr:uncharacterized protein STEHIDRAFT_111306 [Stereum hirsutum FP-91666 SS1]EIM86907.1 hypothetical protein STEHIDRAFT_111306 [Stereum hirsutum FP-91666 SS1]
MSSLRDTRKGSEQANIWASGLPFGILSPAIVSDVRDTIDQEVADLEAAIARLKAYSNSLANTSCLPPEILSNIFVLYATSIKGTSYGYILHWLVVTRVCRSWRAIALDTAELWEHLDTDSITASVRRQALILRSRSKVSIIKIDFSNSHSTSEWVCQASQILAVRHGEVANLDITLSRNTFHKVLGVLDGPNPRLETLVLRSDATRQAPISFLHLFSGQVPLLRRLHVHSCKIMWQHLVTASPRLTHLDIEHTVARISLNGVCDTLRRLPQLEELRLPGFLSVDLEPDYPSLRRIGMLKLRQLKFEYIQAQAGWDNCAKLLKRLELPNLVQIELRYGQPAGAPPPNTHSFTDCVIDSVGSLRNIFSSDEQAEPYVELSIERRTGNLYSWTLRGPQAMELFGLNLAIMDDSDAQGVSIMRNICQSFSSAHTHAFTLPHLRPLYHHLFRRRNRLQAV